MSNSLSKYDVSADAALSMWAEHQKAFKRLIQCYLAADVAREDPQGWQEIIGSDVEKLLQHSPKHILLYFSVGDYKPAVLLGDNVSGGHYYELESPGDYHKLVQSLKCAVLKQLVAPK